MSRVGIRTKVPSTDQVMAVAVWSRGPTMMFAGLSHPKSVLGRELAPQLVRLSIEAMAELSDRSVRLPEKGPLVVRGDEPRPDPTR